MASGLIQELAKKTSVKDVAPEWQPHGTSIIDAIFRAIGPQSGADLVNKVSETFPVQKNVSESYLIQDDSGESGKREESDADERKGVFNDTDSGNGENGQNPNADLVYTDNQANTEINANGSESEKTQASGVHMGKDARDPYARVGTRPVAVSTVENQDYVADPYSLAMDDAVSENMDPRNGNGFIGYLARGVDHRGNPVAVTPRERIIAEQEYLADPWMLSMTSPEDWWNRTPDQQAEWLGQNAINLVNGLGIGLDLVTAGGNTVARNAVTKGLEDIAEAGVKKTLDNAPNVAERVFQKQAYNQARQEVQREAEEKAIKEAVEEGVPRINDLDWSVPESYIRENPERFTKPVSFSSTARVRMSADEAADAADDIIKRQFDDDFIGPVSKTDRDMRLNQAPTPNVESIGRAKSREAGKEFAKEHKSDFYKFKNEDAANDLIAQVDEVIRPEDASKSSWISPEARQLIDFIGGNKTEQAPIDRAMQSFNAGRQTKTLDKTLDTVAKHGRMPRVGRSNAAESIGRDIIESATEARNAMEGAVRTGDTRLFNDAVKALKNASEDAKSFIGKGDNAEGLLIGKDAKGNDVFANSSMMKSNKRAIGSQIMRDALAATNPKFMADGFGHWIYGDDFDPSGESQYTQYQQNLVDWGIDYGMLPNGQLISETDMSGWPKELRDWYAENIGDTSHIDPDKYNAWGGYGTQMKSFEHVLENDPETAKKAGISKYKNEDMAYSAWKENAGPKEWQLAAQNLPGWREAFASNGIDVDDYSQMEEWYLTNAINYTQAMLELNQGDLGRLGDSVDSYTQMVRYLSKKNPELMSPVAYDAQKNPVFEKDGVDGTEASMYNMLAMRIMSDPDFVNKMTAKDLNEVLQLIPGELVYYEGPKATSGGRDTKINGYDQVFDPTLTKGMYGVNNFADLVYQKSGGRIGAGRDLKKKVAKDQKA